MGVLEADNNNACRQLNLQAVYLGTGLTSFWGASYFFWSPIMHYLACHQVCSSTSEYCR